MTDITTHPLSYEIIDELFPKAVCLTYNPTEQTAAWQYGMQLIEQIPDFYLPEIYNKLPEYQKGAAVIHIEILKQKARKLKRLLEIPHHEALDITAQMSGWQNWNSIKIENEAHARHLVHHEVWRKQSVLRQADENPLMWEYQRWQMR